jgi:hypothetical protein
LAVNQVPMSTTSRQSPELNLLGNYGNNDIIEFSHIATGF